MPESAARQVHHLASREASWSFEIATFMNYLNCTALFSWSNSVLWTDTPNLLSPSTPSTRYPLIRRNLPRPEVTTAALAYPVAEYERRMAVHSVYHIVLSACSRLASAASFMNHLIIRLQAALLSFYWGYSHTEPPSGGPSNSAFGGTQREPLGRRFPIYPCRGSLKLDCVARTDETFRDANRYWR